MSSFQAALAPAVAMKIGSLLVSNITAWVCQAAMACPGPSGSAVPFPSPQGRYPEPDDLAPVGASPGPRMTYGARPLDLTPALAAVVPFNDIVTGESLKKTLVVPVPRPIAVPYPAW